MEKRYNVKKMNINGEAGDVRGEKLTLGKRGYKDIRGVTSIISMKLLVFGELCPIMTLVRKFRMQRWQKAKQRVAIVLLANTNGEKEDPILIWKSENPKCFRGIDKTKLPVQYFSQPKGWMTGEILDRVLSKWNRKLRSAVRVRSFSEATNSLEDVKSFLDRKGHSEQASVVSTAIDLVASLNYSSLDLGRLSTLDEYFL